MPARAQTGGPARRDRRSTTHRSADVAQSPGNPVDKDIRDWINDGRVPGPRILTSIHQLFDNSGTPEQIRGLVDQWVKEGADFVKIFASGSIRDGGLKTMSDAQRGAAAA